jgi:hypothetical protein
MSGVQLKGTVASEELALLLL